MKIGVIGTICYDTIILSNGGKFESFGGTLYNIVTLANLTPHEIYPISWIGKDRIRELDVLLKDYPTVKKDGLKLTDKTHKHTLTYSSATHRKECLPKSQREISFSMIEPFLNLDFLLINFIQPFDLPIETLSKIRASFKGPIFMDIHAYAQHHFVQDLGFISYVDILQANEFEANVLSGRELSNYEEFGLSLLRRGLSVALFTLGEKGAFVCYDNKCEFITAENINVKDVTGAGDTFSAGFISNYIETNDPVVATKFAHRAAGACCRSIGLNELKLLKHLLTKT
jgi:sugar/nucleoside kinase (ribokinase family)